VRSYDEAIEGGQYFFESYIVGNLKTRASRPKMLDSLGRQIANKQ